MAHRDDSYFDPDYEMEDYARQRRHDIWWTVLIALLVIAALVYWPAFRTVVLVLSGTLMFLIAAAALLAWARLWLARREGR